MENLTVEEVMKIFDNDLNMSVKTVESMLYNAEASKEQIDKLLGRV